MFCIHQRLCFLMIVIMIVDFNWILNKTNGKPTQSTEKCVLDASTGVNVRGSDHIVGREQDIEGTGW